jgi:hypothetical protein
VKAIPKRFAILLSRLREVNRIGRRTRVQSPVFFSSFVCFATFLFVAWTANPLFATQQFEWVELMIDAGIPIAVTFVFLYGSSWHREISGAKRTLSLILLSFVVFGGVVTSSIVLLVLLCVAYSTFFVGFSHYHY